MKLYDNEHAFNPRRVRMFMAEKSLQFPMQQIDLLKGEHKEPAFLEKNPDGTIPCLELDDGTCLGECVVISRYLEDSYPNPPLMGLDSLESARIEQWNRRLESSLIQPLGQYFHHATPGLGDSGRYRNKEWGEHNRDRIIETIARLNNHLAESGSPFLCGEDFTIADITALCGLDFAIALQIPIPTAFSHLNDWHARVSARPSATS